MASIQSGKIACLIRGLLLPEKYGILFDRQTFPLKHLSWQKKLNYVIQGIRSGFNPWNGFGLPPVLQIEPVNDCNLRCRTCAFGAGLIRRPPEAMPFDLYKSIIDQVANRVSLMAFWAWGEPFAHEEACDMIRYAKDSGLLVHTSTNGHFFTTAAEARRVIDSGLDSIILCVDGLDQRTYETYRVRGQLEKVLTSTENLVTEKRRLGKATPTITLRFIVMKHNEHQVEAFKAMAREMGVDFLSLRLPAVQREKVNLEKTLAPRLMPIQEDSGEKRHRGSRIWCPSSAPCSRPLANLTIFSNGDVVLCENDYNAEFSPGNASRNRIRDILSSRKAKALFKAFRRNPESLPFCRNCDKHDLKGDRLNIYHRKIEKETSA